MENEKKEGFAHSEAEGQEKREGFTEQETENLSENIAAKNREDTVKKKPKIQWFHINERYMSICRYVIFVFLIVTIIYMLVSHIGSTFHFIGHMFHVLTPFLIGLLLAYFFNPLAKLVQRKMDQYIAKGRGKTFIKIISIVVSYVVILGFIIAAFIFVVPEVMQSIRELARKIPWMYGTIIRKVDDLAKQFPDIDQIQLNKQLASALPNLAKLGTGAMGSVVNLLYSWSVSIVKTAINILLGVFISVYMIYSKDMFAYQAKRVVYALCSEEKGDAICETSRECNDIFGAFLISKAMDSLIIGILCCIFMTILRLPYAVLLSVI
ncbi:MAG: AI-2E family transporter, partial [Lachnospiraceae bacterium]|nr:AI-2E family transporter [Lachnospiraceae bacterium]